jgi:hypothetical protein
VGRATSSGNQTTLYLTPMRAELALIESMIANVHAAIQHVRGAAQQLPKLDRWGALLHYICQRAHRRSNQPAHPARRAAGIRVAAVLRFVDGNLLHGQPFRTSG